MTVAVGVVAMALAAVGRAWIPPAPLFVARAAILWDVSTSTTIEALPTDDLRRGGEGARARGVHCDLRAGGLAPAGEARVAASAAG